MKCSFNECKNKAVMGIGWGFSKGTIPICEECLVIYNNHCKARERVI